MKHNKTVFLLPLFFSVMLILILFACYPGIGPRVDRTNNTGDSDDDFPPVYVTSGLRVNGDSTLVIPVGKTYTALSIVNDENEPVILSNLKYRSSDENVATVDANGNITGVSLGKTSIYITNQVGNVSTSVIAQVKDIQINAAADHITREMELQMRSVLLPGSEPLNNVTWRVNKNYADITDTGILSTTLTTSGTVDVVASSTYGNLTKTKTIIIDESDSSELLVHLDESSKLMAKGETYQLTAGVYQNGTLQANPSITWSSSNASVAVVSDGLVTVSDIGNASITASAGESSAVFIVNARSLKIDAPDEALVIKDGVTVHLSAVLSGDPAGDVIADGLKWSLDGNTLGQAAVINPNTGILSIQGAAPGNYSVTVTASMLGNDSIKASKTIDIEIYQDLFIKDDKTSIIMPVGATNHMLKVVDKNGNDVPLNTLTFQSSNENIATVDASGYVFGKNTGDTTITVTSNFGDAKTYVAIHVRGLKVVSSSDSIAKGTPPLQMSAVLSPGGEPLTSATTWTANDNNTSTGSSSITSDGKLSTTRTDSGTVDVIASSTFGNLSAKREPSITIVGIAETEKTIIIINGESSRLAAVNDIIPLTATVYQGGTEVEDPLITWTSGNTNVATVSNDGEVSVIDAGDAVITAASGDDTAEFTVNARTLVIGPEDAKLELSLTGTLLNGVLGSDPLILTATLTGTGVVSTEASSVRWEILDDNTLSLLSTVTIDSKTGELSMEAGLLNLTGVLSVGKVTVQASIPGTNIKRTKDVTIVSVL